MLQVLLNFNSGRILRFTTRLIYMYRNFLRLQSKDLVSFRLEMFCSPSYSVVIRETLNVKEISVTVKVNMTTGGV